MTKKKPNLSIIISIVSTIIGVGALVGSYFIGYNVGISSNHNNTTYNNEIVGAYKRSYYNNYNKSVDSYVVLKEDGTCKYIDSLKTELSTTIDLNETDAKCSYTYDDEAKTGELVIDQRSSCLELNSPEICANTNNPSYKFSYQNGIFTLGAATYSRLR